jgi:uncharacterized membrane protein YbhN (UPF0104 family)
MALLRFPSRFLKRYWAELFALAGLLALVLGVNPLKLGRVFSHVQWEPALLMVPVAIALYVSRGTAWWIALRSVGERVSFGQTQLIEFAGQVMIILPMGDLARVAMVRGGSRDRGAGAITATVALQELTYMMLMSFGALPQIVQRPNVALLMLATTLGFLAVFLVILWEPAYERAIRLVERVGLLRRFDQQLHEIRPAFVRICHWRTLLPLLGVQAVAALLSFLLFYLALLSLGLHVSYITAVFVLGVSYTFAAVSFLPLGIGAFEGLLTVIMLTYGIPAAAGAAAGLLYRGYNDVLMAVIGGPSLLHVRAQQRAGRWRGAPTTAVPAGAPR